MPSPRASRGVAVSSVPVDGLLHAVLDASHDAILSHDRDTRITSWNLTAERVFGYGADDVMGRPCTELFADHVRADVADVLRTVMAGDRVHQHETEVVRKDGMPVPISLTACPVCDGEDLPVAAVLVARDITEQRLAQASLAEIDARVHESEALAHVGSWLWDVRTATVQWSDEFHRIHGVDPLEFLGTLDAHLAPMHPDDRRAVHDAMVASVTSGRAFEAEYRIIRPDTEVRTVVVRAQPTIGSDGAAVGLRGIGQDVTGRA